MKQATRSDLVKLGAEKVRSEPNLFKLFQNYLEEDAANIYPNGQVPRGCFSCTFNSTFEKWKRYVIKSGQYTSNKIIMSNKNSTYELLDRNTRVYFKGEVLDRNSSDEAWNEWINYLTEDDKVEKRKGYFSKIPNSKPDQKVKDIEVKKQEASSTEVKEDESEKESSENDSKEESKEPEKEEVKAEEKALIVKKTRKAADKSDNTIKKTRRTNNS